MLLSVVRLVSAYRRELCCRRYVDGPIQALDLVLGETSRFLHEHDHEDQPLNKRLERILLTAALIPAKSIHVQSLGQEVRSVLAVKLTVRVKTQLMKVLTDVALSLQISEM